MKTRPKLIIRFNGDGTLSVAGMDREGKGLIIPRAVLSMAAENEEGIVPIELTGNVYREEPAKLHITDEHGRELPELEDDEEPPP